MIMAAPLFTPPSGSPSPQDSRTFIGELIWSHHMTHVVICNPTLVVPSAAFLSSLKVLYHSSLPLCLLFLLPGMPHSPLSNR